jgi:hypothetical protein
LVQFCFQVKCIYLLKKKQKKKEKKKDTTRSRERNMWFMKQVLCAVHTQKRRSRFGRLTAKL